MEVAAELSQEQEVVERDVDHFVLRSSESLNCFESQLDLVAVRPEDFLVGLFDDLHADILPLLEELFAGFSFGEGFEVDVEPAEEVLDEVAGVAGGLAELEEVIRELEDFVELGVVIDDIFEVVDDLD